MASAACAAAIFACTIHGFRLVFHFVGYAQAALSSDTLGGGGSIEHACVYPDACARAAHSEKKFSNTDLEPWLE